MTDWSAGNRIHSLSELDQTANLFILARVSPDSVSSRIVCTRQPPSLFTIEQVPGLLMAWLIGAKNRIWDITSYPAVEVFYTIFGRSFPIICIDRIIDKPYNISKVLSLPCRYVDISKWNANSKIAKIKYVYNLWKRVLRQRHSFYLFSAIFWFYPISPNKSSIFYH